MVFNIICCRELIFVAKRKMPTRKRKTVHYRSDNKAKAAKRSNSQLKYDGVALVSQDDQTRITPVLNCLKEKWSIFDSSSISPGKSEMEEILKAGSESLVTILFLSKNFLEDKLLVYFAKEVTRLQVENQGKHFVVALMLDIESYDIVQETSLSMFIHCIPYWQYEENSDARDLNTPVSELVQAITDRTVKEFLSTFSVLCEFLPKLHLVCI